MRISDKKQTALYSAIHDEFMNLRIDLKRKPLHEQEDLDSSLYYLMNRIWSQIESVLKLDKGE